jgi:hypothetical protein
VPQAEVACANCRKTIVDDDGLRVTGRKPGGRPFGGDLCSWSCLTEWAFTMREKQPKLSKSRASDADTNANG